MVLVSAGTDRATGWDEGSQSKAALVVDVTGQFINYEDLQGLGQRMDHMVLSCNSNSNCSKTGDLEE